MESQQDSGYQESQKSNGSTQKNHPYRSVVDADEESNVMTCDSPNAFI